MNIRRFTGTDMRDAMRQVREALGAEAVILETTRSGAGVEITAAVDRDGDDLPALAPLMAGATLPAAALASIAVRQSATARATPLASYSETATAGEGADADAIVPEERPSPAVLVGGRRPVPDTWFMPARAASAPAASDFDRLREELTGVRALLETQLSRLLWDDGDRRDSANAQLLRTFSQLGFDADVARSLTSVAQRLGEGSSGWTAVLRAIVASLPVTTRDVVADGGIFAVIGPTGVGKTTTIAKLAARAALQDGADRVGLVTMDTLRVAAREQLETFGQILGIPVHQANDTQTLDEVLAQLADRRTVLIDTAGMGQRDPRLTASLAALAVPGRTVETLLALAAPSHSGALQETVDAFRTASPAACILTKTDEAVSLGGALSAVIRANLPLAYVANGQRVPEDLHLLRDRQAWLAKMAVELLRRRPITISEDEMAQRFSEVATHAYA